jgi:hypothetical protein
MSAARGDADGMTYLVRQGQKEVVEEDGGDRNRIILASVAHC